MLQKTIIKKVVEGLLHKKLLLGSFFFITKTLNGAWEFLRDISDRMNGAREKKHFIESKEEKNPLLKDTVRESEKILLYKDKRFRRTSV